MSSIEKVLREMATVSGSSEEVQCVEDHDPSPTVFEDPDSGHRPKACHESTPLQRNTAPAPTPSRSSSHASSDSAEVPGSSRADRQKMKERPAARRRRPRLPAGRQDELASGEVVDVDKSSLRVTPFITEASQSQPVSVGNVQPQRKSTRIRERKEAETAGLAYNSKQLRRDRLRRSRLRQSPTNMPHDSSDDMRPAVEEPPIQVVDDDEDQPSPAVDERQSASAPEHRQDAPGRTKPTSTRRMENSDDEVVHVDKAELAEELKNLSAIDAPYNGPTHLIFEYPPGQRGKIRVTEEERGRLTQKKYLNDSLIDFYIKYQERDIERRAESTRFTAKFFSSFFFGRLRRTKPIDYQGVKGWTKNVDIFSKQFVFVPICDSYHWSLIIVANLNKLAHVLDNNMGLEPTNSDSPRIIYLDSLDPKRGTEFGETMRQYLAEEWLARKLKVQHREVYRVKATTMSFRKAIPILKPNVPIQTNEYDCGLYLLNSLVMFLENKDGLRDKLLSGHRDMKSAYTHIDVAILRKEIVDLMNRLEGIWSSATTRQLPEQEGNRKGRLEPVDDEEEGALQAALHESLKAQSSEGQTMERQYVQDVRDVEEQTGDTENGEQGHEGLGGRQELSQKLPIPKPSAPEGAIMEQGMEERTSLRQQGPFPDGEPVSNVSARDSNPEQSGGKPVERRNDGHPVQLPEDFEDGGRVLAGLYESNPEVEPSELGLPAYGDGNSSNAVVGFAPDKSAEEDLLGHPLRSQSLGQHGDSIEGGAESPLFQDDEADRAQSVGIVQAADGHANALTGDKRDEWEAAEAGGHQIEIPGDPSDSNLDSQTGEAIIMSYKDRTGIKRRRAERDSEKAKPGPSQPLRNAETVGNWGADHDNAAPSCPIAQQEEESGGLTGNLYRDTHRSHERSFPSSRGAEKNQDVVVTVFTHENVQAPETLNAAMATEDYHTSQEISNENVREKMDIDNSSVSMQDKSDGDVEMR